jgi:hypothetical protein
MFPGAEFHPAQRKLIDERPTAAPASIASRERLRSPDRTVSTKVTIPASSCPLASSGRSSAIAAAMSHPPNAAFAKTAFEIRSGLPGSARRARSK